MIDKTTLYWLMYLAVCIAAGVLIGKHRNKYPIQGQADENEDAGCPCGGMPGYPGMHDFNCSHNDDD